MYLGLAIALIGIAVDVLGLFGIFGAHPDHPGQVPLMLGMIIYAIGVASKKTSELDKKESTESDRVSLDWSPAGASQLVLSAPFRGTRVKLYHRRTLHFPSLAD